MKALKGLLIAGSAALLLSGCFGGSDKVVRYYTLPIPEVKNATADPVFPYTLMVTHASVDPAYRRNNIVYRETPYDFMFYTYSVWAARPEFLIEQAATSTVKSSALFKVLDSDAAAKPELEFMIHVNAVEEVDHGKDREARLAMTLTLRKTESNDFIWRKSYDESKSYNGEDMRYFAESISALLQGFMVDAMDGVKRVLSFVPVENVKDDVSAPAELPAPEEVPAADGAEAPAAPEVDGVAEGE